MPNIDESPPLLRRIQVFITQITAVFGPYNRTGYGINEFILNPLSQNRDNTAENSRQYGTDGKCYEFGVLDRRVPQGFTDVGANALG